MSKTQSTTRQDKAIELINAGAVTLNFDGTATVKGSGKAVYTVTCDGCPCPDFTQRGEVVGPCKHLIAVKAICTVYRRCLKEARETGRVRLPANLAKALPRRAPAGPEPTAPTSAQADAAELNRILFGDAA